VCHATQRYTTTISGQGLGKHVPRATNRCAIIEVLLETGFVLGPCRGVIRKNTAVIKSQKGKEQTCRVKIT
jgi:hypothetical protein